MMHPHDRQFDPPDDATTWTCRECKDDASGPIPDDQTCESCNDWETSIVLLEDIYDTLCAVRVGRLKAASVAQAAKITNLLAMIDELLERTK